MHDLPERRLDLKKHLPGILPLAEPKGIRFPRTHPDLLHAQLPRRRFPGLRPDRIRGGFLRLRDDEKALPLIIQIHGMRIAQPFKSPSSLSSTYW